MVVGRRTGGSRRRDLAPALGLAVLLCGVAAGLFAAAPAARAASPHPAIVHPTDGATVTGVITGPSSVGPTTRSVYHVTATGGPAIAANGTQVGTLSFTTSIVGVNTTGGAVNPPQGVFINGSTNLTMIAPNATEPLTLYVDITSSFGGHNSSTNLSYGISVLQPIVLGAGLKVVGPTSVKAFSLAVLLDGAVVGHVAVPSLTAGQNYPVTFSYLGQGLSPGWHTFTISLAEEHGLVAFSNGLESYSQSFYVAGPPPNNSIWYLTGLVAFAGAVVIWTTLFGARRRTKGKG